MNQDTPPGLEVSAGTRGKTVRLSGQWTALALARDRDQGGAARRLRALAEEHIGEWDLSGVERMDHVGGQALWRVWGHKLPSDLVDLTQTQRDIFERIALLDSVREPAERVVRIDPVTQLGLAIFSFFDHLYGGIAMFGRVILDLLLVVRKPRVTPWIEISANIYNAGARALPITALVAFLIGIVLSYLSAQQLRLFGANQYIVNILGLAVIRELGPVLSAILVAGRSGSAITAQIGVMRVTEELDAMRVMGISHGLRLILPRVIALGVAMPLLVIWTDIIALLGGAIAAKIVLGIDISWFMRSMPSVVPIANLWIGLGKGVAFGMLVAIVGCHFGFRIKANSQSLGEGTTTSVVTSITIVILADAVFAILFQNVGLS
ncbi:MlaE family ABC transporter permease [Paraburkholderia silvatlantica]|uniref:Phospholipid/cholesterol/gamma-HCH transport system permease protein n=1 Tax=Paraburkholderia silvatlantica TaxID=321895 RepID=A0A2U1AKT1_9BURK|nr:ABC transporter permease [Paraburkholderia silvatlantica]MBB2927306.1 phospholipid/cholesterol/gamma-HCH transport system permease protein [Paraburkholderia silvatlantica]PVY37023.1 phospholipid/cholesterol/gamma-HCH transport system permease protein [Paraburkholderia silvatlantica]PXW41699.1 phospholipid/cholesterol/gamma-HCH transport system permease protein [Paraburkholderia silvatlantica]PYE26166.1 phospholipid/cholesterol/gamma-HCH transport system permease protein [Paraburkholderia sil